MITSLTRRVLPVVAVGILLGAVVNMQQRPPLAGDGYFHLRMGHEFLDGWSIGDPGHLGPYDTAQWVPTQWLSQMAMAGIENMWGLAGVIWAAGLVMLLITVATYASCRVTTAPLAAAIATVAAVFAASPGFTARPQLFSYLLTVVFTAAWLATLRDGRPRWWLVALAWVWAPLHGMWPVGILIGLAAVTGLALERRVTPPRLAKLMAIPVLSMLVVTATPAGFGTYSGIFAVGGRSEYFAEWDPPTFTEPYAIVLLLMLAVVVVVGIRGTLPWGQLALLAVAGLWTVTAARTTPVAAMMLAPLVAEAIQRFIPTSQRPTLREQGTLLAMLALAALAMVPVVQARASTPIAPAWLDAQLDEMPVGTAVLNEWDEGAYFLWRHPQLALVMHGYGDVFTDAELERNVDVLRVKAHWDDRVRELDPDIAVVDPDSALGYALTSDLGWEVVEGDDDFQLLSPPQSSG